MKNNLKAALTVLIFGSLIIFGAVCDIISHVFYRIQHYIEINVMQWADKFMDKIKFEKYE